LCYHRSLNLATTFIQNHCHQPQQRHHWTGGGAGAWPRAQGHTRHRSLPLRGRSQRSRHGRGATWQHGSPPLREVEPKEPSRTRGHVVAWEPASGWQSQKSRHGRGATWQHGSPPLRALLSGRWSQRSRHGHGACGSMGAHFSGRWGSRNGVQVFDSVFLMMLAFVLRVPGAQGIDTSGLKFTW
jgi:hypothetical protein